MVVLGLARTRSFGDERLHAAGSHAVNGAAVKTKGVGDVFEKLAEVPDRLEHVEQMLARLLHQVNALKGQGEEDLLDIKQAAALLGTTPAGLRQAILRGRQGAGRPIPHHRLGREFRFRRAELLALLERG